MATDGKRPHFFKRKLLIEPRFQLEMIGFFSGAAAVVLLGLVWAVNMATHRLIDQSSITQLGPGSAVYDALVAQYEGVVKLILLFGIILEAFIVFGALVLSNRVAGPLYRTLKALRSPDSLNQLKFRKSDYYPELAEAINEIIRANKK